MIRILHLVNNLGAGGAERQLYYIIKYTEKRQFSHQIITLMGKNRLDRIFKDLGIEVTNLGLDNFSLRFRTITSLKKIHKNLLLNETSILHSWLYHPNFYAAVVRSVSPKLKLIVSKRGQNFWYKRKHFLFNRITYNVADGILVNSNHLKKSILAYMSRVERKIYVIPNVLDIPENIDPIPMELCQLRQKGKFVVGIVGRFAAEKEPILALEALNKLINKIPEICFVFVGDGKLLDKCKEYVQQHGLESSCYFAGFHEDVFPWYRGFDVYLLTSSKEGLPNTVLEALGMGLPIVSTAVGAVPDIIENNQNGLLVEPYNCEALTAVISQIYNSSEMRNRLSRNGKVTSKKFSITTIKTYENMYRSLVGLA
jgi:glycosyltransferase involved in cell wall biosynthesis